MKTPAITHNILYHDHKKGTIDGKLDLHRRENLYSLLIATCNKCKKNFFGTQKETRDLLHEHKCYVMVISQLKLVKEK